MVALPAAAVTATADDGAREATSTDLAAVPAKVARYLDAVMERRDRDRDGVLGEEEWRAMGGDPQTIDRDQDGSISRSELQMHVLAYGRARTPVSPLSPSETAALTQVPGQTDPIALTDGSATPPPSTGDPVDGETHEALPLARTPRFTIRPSRGLGNLPGWFLSRDADGDGQLTLREFVGNSAGNRREFDRLDGNGDGVVTPREAAAPPTSDPPANR